VHFSRYCLILLCVFAHMGKGEGSPHDMPVQAQKGSGSIFLTRSKPLHKKRVVI
jgi:hypothetical protein